MSTLIFCDGHDSPGTSQVRFTKLGNFIEYHTDIDEVIALGDMGEFESLSGHVDKGTLADKQKPPFMKDLKNLQNAMSKVRDQVKREGVNFKYQLGNHEERFRRWMQKHPEFFGHDNMVEVFQEWFPDWEVFDYNTMIRLPGYPDVSFTHCMKNARGRPLEGVTAPRTGALMSDGCVITGHVHSRQIHTPPLAPGSKPRQFHILSCFMENGTRLPYQKDAACGWTYGFSVLTSNGRGKLPHITDYSMKELDLYGSESSR